MFTDDGMLTLCLLLPSSVSVIGVQSDGTEVQRFQSMKFIYWKTRALLHVKPSFCISTQRLVLFCDNTWSKSSMIQLLVSTTSGALFRCTHSSFFQSISLVYDETVFSHSS